MCEVDSIRPDGGSDGCVHEREVGTMDLHELAESNDAVEQLLERVAELEDALDLYRRLERRRVIQYVLKRSDLTPKELAGQSLNELRELAEEVTADYTGGNEHTAEQDSDTAGDDRRGFE